MARLDTALFDEARFDTEVSSSPVPVDASLFKIGDYALLGDGIDVNVSRFNYSAPQFEAGIRGYPRADGAYVESQQFRQTKLLLRGSLRKASAVLLEQEMDLMRQAFARNTLLMGYWAGERRFWDVIPTGIANLFEEREGYHINWTPWQIELLCTHPYARSSGRETFAGTNATAVETTYEITNNGSAPSESIIDLVITVAGTLEEFSWENETTGEILTIDNGAAFSNGDTIAINTETKVVTKNGSIIDYVGLLPRVDPGTNTCTLTALTGSGHTITVNERHYRRFY